LGNAVTVVILIVVLGVLLLGGLTGLVVTRRRARRPLAPPAPAAAAPPVAPPAARPASVEAPVDVAPQEPRAPEAPELEIPPPSAGRLVRLRSRLSRSEGTLGRGLLTLLSRDTIDDDVWDEVEEALLLSDVGVGATLEIVESLRGEVRVMGTRSVEELRAMLQRQLVAAIGGDLDRTIHSARHESRPAVLLVVGVNGTGKTTTCGKLARVLVGDGRSVVLGAADTFRAAAADQLSTWGAKVGATVVRGPEGGDPASVAFDAVATGIEQQADAVIVDTAGRLHNKAGLMDELGKVKRVVERHGPLDEVLLVLDATTGQNGLVQARAFAEIVDITGIVLTKLDGTAKGGIVIAVQRELGVPVKLVGLGEGPDDLAPFEPDVFVSALLGADDTA
jgi:fused signal recognition particle receptor